MPTGCINNFPQRGVVGHVATKFLAYISSKLLELGISILLHSFVFGKPSGHGKKIFRKRGVS